MYNVIYQLLAADLEKPREKREEHGHEVDSFGIGTYLVTFYAQAALGCVFKLVGINKQLRIKLSEDVTKMALIARLQHPYTVEFKEAWVEKTGLGDRIATYFIKWLGGSTLGLSYGLTVSEARITPAMPSTTARAGGVFLPIIKSLALSAGSKPNDQLSRKLGSYLVMTQFQKKSEVVLENNSRLEEQMADPSTSFLPEGHRMGLGGMDEKGRDVTGAYEVGGGRWATGVE
ncbi:2-oxoglutarate/malate translocator, chloroplastic [Hordeum vulgare]|nr:2-oxoglutarate/malate translocator, chloroplastic [Hordeum vulgare]